MIKCYQGNAEVASEDRIPLLFLISNITLVGAQELPVVIWVQVVSKFIIKAVNSPLMPILSDQCIFLMEFPTSVGMSIRKGDYCVVWAMHLEMYDTMNLSMGSFESSLSTEDWDKLESISQEDDVEEVVLEEEEVSWAPA